MDNICKPIVLLNNACNFKCIHCYVKNGESELPIEYIKNFFEKTIIPNNSKFVRFAGGEPFMYSNFHELAVYLSKVHEKYDDIQFNFTTNGSILNENIIKDLKIINPNMVKVSLLSLREDKYREINGINFPIDKTLRNIKKLKQHFPIGINMTIMRDTVQDIKPLVAFCLENDIHDLFFSQLTPAGRGSQISSEKLTMYEINTIKSYLNSIDKNKINIRYDDGCSCGFYQDYVLNWDGDVFPCCALTSHKEFKIGRYDTSLADMRKNIDVLNKNRTKTCFVEEFVRD